MKKLNKKSFVGLLVFFIILIAISLFIGYGVPVICKQSYTEEKTNEYTATFKRVERENNYYLIYVEEYSCALNVEPASIMNMESFNSLKHGDKIVVGSLFKIEDFNEKMPQMGIISLKSQNTDIITLESSKNAVTEADIKIRLTATVFSIFFLIGAIICILYIVGVLKTKQKTKTE